MEESALQCRDHVWNQDNKAQVQFHFAEELDEVRAVVGHKREFIRRYSLRKRRVRLAAQAEVVDVRCRGARGMGDPYQDS